MKGTWPWSSGDMVLFGGDYNPEQWLDSPEVLEEDLRLMGQAGVTVVSVGVFSWSFLEPEEGVFCFEWLDSVLDGLHAKGIKVFLATPSAARPDWMAARYPEVLRVRPDGTRNLFGGRHNHCFSSPVYREKVGIINRELVLRYEEHPAVILWHISNEYSGECHCELCQENFRRWLQKRYGSLDELNRAWWSSFWSHTYTDWSHIHSPVPHGEVTLHGLSLDWKRFVTDMTVDFLDHEVSVIRQAGSLLPVTTNMMASCNDISRDPGLDYWKFRGHLDISSWDSYPAWHMPGHESLYLEDSSSLPDDYRRASEEAFQHDLFRCLGDGRFLLMESTPSSVNWQLRSKIKKPGMIALSGLHAVSHGASSVQYFQWRKSRGSYEKFHGAFVGHDAVVGSSYESRVFRECSALGRMLSELGKGASSVYRTDAALLYSWENRWAFEGAKDVVNGPAKGFFQEVKRHYFSLWSQGIALDILCGDEDYSVFSQKKLIAAPMLYLLPESLAEKLARFVHDGGNLVCTYMSGHVGESDLCYPGGAPGPLREVLGVRVEETDGLYPGEDISMTGYGASDIPVYDYQDVIYPQGAEVLARFRGGLADGMSALTVNRYGKGSAWYLGGRIGASSLSAVYDPVRRESGCPSSHDLVESRSGAVDIQLRSTEGQVYVFVMNFSGQGARVVFKEPLTEVSPNDAPYGRSWELPAYGAKVLTRKL